MKVERKEPGFEPITITIETRDEAIAMWAALNCKSTMKEEALSGYEKPKDDEVFFSTFDDFDEVFTPNTPTND